jgi:rhodanese-related sulfurtransferase
MKKMVLTVLLIWTLAMPALAMAFQEITSAEAKSLLGKGGSVFLLDVRTPEEYRQGHLQGAVLIPISEIEKRVGDVPPNKKIVVYCAVGSRSRQVAGFLTSKGYREVYDMKDGIIGWYRNGFPIAR